MKTQVDQRLSLLENFAACRRRFHTPQQIGYACEVLLTNLRAGELISDSIMRADAAMTDDGAVARSHQPIVRHFQ